MGDCDGLIYITNTMYKITSENILKNTGNDIMHCGDLNEKDVQKRGNACICMVDSFFYTAETNTVL